MSKIIINHAKENVWAAPEQDRDFIITPARITPHGGSLRYVDITWGKYKLPHFENLALRYYYHVYQIGQIPPHILGLLNLKDEWVNVDTIAHETDCFVNVFLDNGMMVKRSECWLRYILPENNIVMAIINDQKYDLGTTYIDDGLNNQVIGRVRLDDFAVNVRFYTNARTNSLNWRDEVDVPDNQVDVIPAEILTLSDYNRFRGEALALDQSKIGWVKRDARVTNLSVLYGSSSDWINHEAAIYYDETIIGIKYFRLSELRSFKSERDRNAPKYILNLGDANGPLIYHNDVEYFLGNYVGGRFEGVYIPRQRPDDIRMLTHAIHAIRCDTVLNVKNLNFEWMPRLEDLAIMAVIRQGGMVRGLTHQHTRIEDIYRLPTSLVESALSETNSLLTEWRASSLEQDAYSNLISAKENEITSDLVTNAYGYNALTKIFHPLPVVLKDHYTFDGNSMIAKTGGAFKHLPQGVVNKEPIETLLYDKDGKFIGPQRQWFTHEESLVYHVDKNSTRKPHLVEYYLNKASTEPNGMYKENYETSIISNDLKIYGFACYACTVNPDGTPSLNWLDVTNGGLYTYNENYNHNGSPTSRFDWHVETLAAQNLVGMVRINNDVAFINVPKTTLRSGGTDYLTYKVPSNTKGGTYIEPGMIDIYMDQYKLIENIDYIVKWPIIYILKVPENMVGNVSFRFYGLPNPRTVRHWEASELGFVRNGILSVDNEYDVRDDRNIQINVAGCLKHRDEVCFSEDRKGPRLEDGRPYEIREYITPIEFFSSGRTTTMKQAAVDLDKKVTAYLSNYIEEEPTGLQVVKEYRWRLISPFINSLYTRIKAGWLETELKKPWDSNDVSRWVQDSLHLLAIDPVTYGFDYHNYLKIIPHAEKHYVDLTKEQYRFLDSVNRNYLKGRVNLSTSFRIIEE